MRTSKNRSIFTVDNQKNPSRTWVEIDLSALCYNVQIIKKLAPTAAIIAVVKANAYGHGIEKVATTIAPHVAYFAVANLQEALILESLQLKRPIFLLSAALPAEYPAIAKHGFIPTISSYEEALLFSKVAPADASIHFKINTGMGRLGVWHANAKKTLLSISKLPLSIQSISTHLPSADSEAKFTRAQIAFFKNLLPDLKKHVPNAFIHLLNSAGLLRFPEEAHDAVRIGLLLYGSSPIASEQKLLRPVMTWKAHISLISHLPKGSSVSYGRTYRASTAITSAILPVGYADGYPRHLSGKKAYVLIKGKRAPILGRVTMDQIMVDISKIRNVRIGDEVVLLGQQGRETILASDLAKKAETIAWDIFTGVSSRVSYFYKIDEFCFTL